MREIGSVADDLDVGAILEGRFTHMAALWDAHFGEARAIIESPFPNLRNTKASLYSFVTYYSVGNNYYKLNIPYYIVKKILYYYYKGYIDFLAIFWWNRFV